MACVGKELVINFVQKAPVKSKSFFPMFRSSSKSNLTKASLSSNPSNPSSGDEHDPHETGSENGSVLSDSFYGTKIQQITLQAESAEVMPTFHSFFISNSNHKQFSRLM